MGIIKVILAVVGLISLFFGAIPIVGYRFINAGVVVLLGLSALCFLQLCLLREDSRQRRPWEVFSGKGRFVRVLRRLIGVGFVLFLVVELAFSVAMVMVAQLNTPTYSQPTTAVVLGCQVIEDKPSKMLQNRLEQALLYLAEMPQAKIVVTGGQGVIEKYAEADIEAAWLIEKGIAPERIIIENRSTSTAENIGYMAELLVQNQLPPEAMLFTDGFHQLRSQYYARQNGVTAVGVSSNTPWGLLPCYWLREQMAICDAWLSANGLLSLGDDIISHRRFSQ